MSEHAFRHFVVHNNDPAPTRVTLWSIEYEDRVPTLLLLGFEPTTVSLCDWRSVGEWRYFRRVFLYHPTVLILPLTTYASQQMSIVEYPAGGIVTDEGGGRHRGGEAAVGAPWTNPAARRAEGRGPACGGYPRGQGARPGGVGVRCTPDGLPN